MSGIRRVSDLGTQGVQTILDGSIQTADIANNAITQAKMSTDVPLSGMRNALINGDFRIWQRGVGPTATSTGIGQGYLADRWNCARGGYAAGGTVSRQSAGLTGFQFCSRIQRTNGNTSTALFYYFQTLETSNSLPFAGQQATYSFYARAGSTFTGSILARLLGGTATDQLNYPDSAITGQSAVVSQNITLTTSWQRFTFTGTVGAAVTQLFAGFEWTPSGTAGVNDFFEITGVQLEIGPQATPFEQRLIDLEIQLCQRYFSKSFQLSTAPANANGTGDNSGNNLVVWAPTVSNSYSATIPFPVRMRRTPDVILYNAENTTANTWSVYNATTAINNSYSVIVGNRNERSMMIFATGITTITVSNGAWAASAEL